MTGTCARRSPWSRLGALAARAAFIGGLCVGGWLGTNAVASAEQAGTESLVVEVAEPQIELRTEEPEVARPEIDEPAVERPEIDTPEITVPRVEYREPETGKADRSAAIIDETGSAPAPEAPARQDIPAPAATARSTASPEQPLQTDAAEHLIPQPRGPDAPAHFALPNGPAPDQPAPQAPATTVSAGPSGGVGGLRYPPAVVLPAVPDLSDAAITGVGGPENPWPTGRLSSEKSVSPD